MSKQLPDPRNRELQVYVDGRMYHRDSPALTVYDSGFLHGKQFWSSPRLIEGRVFRLPDHLAKIRHSAELVGCPIIPTDEEFIRAIRLALKTNNMRDGVHIRVIMTAGTQVTASMDIGSVTDWEGESSRPTIVIMPEYRGFVYNQQGITLITSKFRRPGPEFANQNIHDNNQNHSSRACSEAKSAGATASLLFDAQGYVAETHASHVGVVVGGKLLTPTTRCCPPGVTRQVIFELCEQNGIEALEADIAADELRDADEVFVMGTMSGPVPAVELDGVVIGNGKAGPITARLQKLYQAVLRDPAHSYDIFAETAQ